MECENLAGPLLGLLPVQHDCILTRQKPDTLTLSFTGKSLTGAKFWPWLTVDQPKYRLNGQNAEENTAPDSRLTLIQMSIFYFSNLIF